MLNTSDFILEYPELTYDHEALKIFVANLEGWAPNMHFMREGYDTSLCHFYDRYVDATSTLLTSTIHKAVTSLLPTTDLIYKFTKVLAGGVMPYHIDPQRCGVLMIPISDYPSKVCWKDDTGQIIFEHTYKCPTIINAKILHGVPYTPTDRVFLQGSVVGSWESLVANRRQVLRSL